MIISMKNVKNQDGEGEKVEYVEPLAFGQFRKAPVVAETKEGEEKKEVEGEEDEDMELGEEEGEKKATEGNNSIITAE